MAIAWDVKITVLNKVEKRVSITATRQEINDTDPDNPIVTNSQSFTVCTIIGTSAENLATLDFIWDKYQKSLIEQTTVNEIIDDLETKAKENLEAREV